VGSLTPRAWEASGITHQGNIRDHNEDAFLDLSSENLWVVADGMGGHTSGEVASKAIVDTLRDFHATRLLGQNIRLIRQLLENVNQYLIDQSGDDEENIIGSTLAALLIAKKHGVCLWAGDSRLYRLRSGVLKQVSRDHNELDELIDSGVPPEQAMLSPFAGAITRAVGGDSHLQIEAQILEIENGDIYLLCSDGLNKELSDSEIQDILSRHMPGESVKKLLDTALSRKGQDNITALVVYNTLL
jgi:serine/threonine protein phosphatase PrpC